MFHQDRDRYTPIYRRVRGRTQSTLDIPLDQRPNQLSYRRGMVRRISSYIAEEEMSVELLLRGFDMDMHTNRRTTDVDEYATGFSQHPDSFSDDLDKSSFSLVPAVSSAEFQHIELARLKPLPSTPIRSQAKSSNSNASHSTGTWSRRASRVSAHRRGESEASSTPAPSLVHEPHPVKFAGPLYTRKESQPFDDIHAFLPTPPLSTHFSSSTNLPPDGRDSPISSKLTQSEQNTHDAPVQEAAASNDFALTHLQTYSQSMTLDLWPAALFSNMNSRAINKIRGMLGSAQDESRQKMFGSPAKLLSQCSSPSTTMPSPFHNVSHRRREESVSERDRSMADEYSFPSSAAEPQDLQEEFSTLLLHCAAEESAQAHELREYASRLERLARARKDLANKVYRRSDW